MPYLKTTKSKLVNDQTGGFIFYKKLMPDRKIEVKNIRTHLGQTSSVIYNISSGRYFVDNEKSVPIKFEFESDDEIEAREARLVSKPNEKVGTILSVCFMTAMTLYATNLGETNKDKCFSEVGA